MSAGRTRPRGFVPYNPRAKARQILEQVGEILEEYREHLPLTLRQIFYRLVGTRGYEKTENAYEALGEIINRARRGELISFAAIRDDGVTNSPAPGWTSTDQFFTTVRDWIDRFELDRQAGQKRRIILICEAAGMVPQLERVAHPFGVEVISSGGFDSTTAKHALAVKIAELPGQAAEVLHIGDHDPSGCHVFSSLAEDVAAFFGSDCRFTRLAVTPEQVVAMGLPTAPAKATDRRGFSGINGDRTATAQAEAIPPDDLASIVREAIEVRLDPVALDGVIEAEKHAKADLRQWLEGRP